MNALFANTATRVWLLLLAATLMSWELGTGASRTTLSVVMLLIVAVKIRLVYIYFMELKHAPFLWRALLDGWLGVVTGALIWLLLY